MYVPMYWPKDVICVGDIDSSIEFLSKQCLTVLHSIQHSRQPISYYYDLLSVLHREFDENQLAALFLVVAKFDNKVTNEEKLCLRRFTSCKEAYQATRRNKASPL